MSGGTIWLTGLSGSGKSTIANHVASKLRERGERVEVLDGDELRKSVSAELGFSHEDRNTHVTRVGFIADLLARNDVWAIVAVIAPYAEARNINRIRHEKSGSRYIEIYLSASIDECSRRDVKGLYAQAKAGSITGMTGVDDPYEVPKSPELSINTAEKNVDESVSAVLSIIERMER